MSEGPTVPPKQPVMSPRSSSQGGLETDFDDGRTIIAPITGQQPSPNEPINPGLDVPQDDEDRTIISFGHLPETDKTVTQNAPINLTENVEPIASAPVMPLQKLEPGYIINNMYRVLQPLGQGGMGRVFRGEEIGTGEPVAIKVILPEIAEDNKAADMFRREARTLRLLHHDAIVRYFAYLPPDQALNLHALVMGFIEGTKLSDRIKTLGGLSLSEVCRLFIRLTDGLVAAHELGVVHRDLSPDNVMLPDGNIDKAILIDFGISRSSTIKDVTLGNEFAGKLKYVSPEQLGAYGNEADGKSDIYSLGLLMYAAATGIALPMGSTIVEAVKLRETVPDLSQAPAELQSLLYQMLQPDPSMRPQTMEVVQQALTQIAGGNDLSLPDGQTMTSGFPMMKQASTNRPVEGLQAAPSMGGGTITSFGAFASTSASSGASSERDEAPVKEPRRQRGGIFWAVVFVLLGLGSFVGWSGWQELTELQEETDSDGVLKRVADGEETFLAEATAPGCAFATRRSYGPNEGMIEGFHLDTVSLSGLKAAWSARFGTNLALVDHTVEVTQCPALALARMFQGTSGTKIELSLTSNLRSRREEISGSIWNTNDRETWLAIVTPRGQVYALTPRIEEAVGAERNFQFRVRSGSPGKYLLIAVTSAKALVRTGAMKNGEASENIFELIVRELMEAEQPSVDVAFVNLLP